MPSLQVRELPENIYRQLKKRAQSDHRSLSQEAIAILAEGLNTSVSPKQRRTKLLQQIAEQPKSNNKMASAPDPVALIREDRKR